MNDVFIHSLIICMATLSGNLDSYFSQLKKVDIKKML